jgi:GNAT superfamily N-acetyltransferase
MLAVTAMPAFALGRSKSLRDPRAAVPSLAMATTVRGTDDPKHVLDAAGGFLAKAPVLHNVILTLLHARIAHPEPGRYWIVETNRRVVGVVFRSPQHYIATITPMPSEAVTAAVEAIAGEGVLLPGVSGEATTTARFAGHWTERTQCGAIPTQGQRIYEVEAVLTPRPAPGKVRAVTPDDLDLAVAWVRAFQRDIGETSRDDGDIVAQRLEAGHLWIWDDDEPVALAGVFEAVEGVARIGPVYTPPDRRGRGYASALVGEVSDAVLTRGQRCILYTDLENPTSNSIYRALGYRAVAEALKYRFDLTSTSTIG